MAQAHFVKDYATHIAQLRARLESDGALRAAVGGEFEAIGKLELALLQQYGLSSAPARVIDIGCGSGRLAVQLARYPDLDYVGTDIMPDLLDYAQRLANRLDWKFVHTDGVVIPAESESADFVCFFSVFTHILHQETYRYLEAARSVLKPGGVIAFTFLEFSIACHWEVFANSVDASRRNAHLDQFISRDAIVAWAGHLDLEVVQIADGDKPHIPLAEPVAFEDGRVMRDLGNFGQSVAVLRKRG